MNIIKNIIKVSLLVATAAFAQNATESAVVANSDSASAKTAAEASVGIQTQKDSAHKVDALHKVDTLHKDDASHGVAAKTPASFREKRGKKTYTEYRDSVVSAKRDSALLDRYKHWITFSGGRLYDKHLGEFADDFVWGSNLATYYMYRYTFNPYVALQGRAGFLYRYGRFNDELDFGSIRFDGKSYKKKHEKESKYKNYAIDVPLSVKTGYQVYDSYFIFATLTLGVTKSIYERISVTDKVIIENPSEDLKNALTYVDNYPYEKSHKTNGAFDGDDWETNSWIGAGVEFKYVSVEFQALIAANSTKDNHRFQNMFHKKMPTWRVMVDFGIN